MSPAQSAPPPVNSFRASTQWPIRALSAGIPKAQLTIPLASSLSLSRRNGLRRLTVLGVCRKRKRLLPPLDRSTSGHLQLAVKREWAPGFTDMAGLPLASTVTLSLESSLFKMLAAALLGRLVTSGKSSRLFPSKSVSSNRFAIRLTSRVSHLPPSTCSSSSVRVDLPVAPGPHRKRLNCSRVSRVKTSLRKALSRFNLRTSPSINVRKKLLWTGVICVHNPRAILA